MPRHHSDKFRRLVIKEIGPKYLDITEKYAIQALNIHKQGYDPVGFLTLKKEIISILNERKSLIGFCVLTYKRGGSVKTGPTIFLKRYQKHGYGILLRKALEEKLKQEGMRKVYCTSSSNNKAVVRYLLASGYKVEIQLAKQYGIYDELVFGKFLIETPSQNIPLVLPDLQKNPGILHEVNIEKLKTQFVDFIQKQFSIDVIEISKKVAKNFVRDSFRSKDLTYEDKPKKIFAFSFRNKIGATALLLPKRGGSIKCVLLSSVKNVKLIREMINKVEEYAIQENRHRLYFTIPENRLDIIHALKEENYKIEGILHSPYKANVNFYVIFKSLKP